jgi:hypothetical protein
MGNTGLWLAQHCPDYWGSQITGVRITEGPLYIISYHYSLHINKMYKKIWRNVNLHRC